MRIGIDTSASSTFVDSCELLSIFSTHHLCLAAPAAPAAAPAADVLTLSIASEEDVEDSEEEEEEDTTAGPGKGGQRGQLMRTFSFARSTSSFTNQLSPKTKNGWSTGPCAIGIVAALRSFHSLRYKSCDSYE